MLRPLSASIVSTFLCFAPADQSRANWIPETEEDSKGTKCTLITGSTYQESGEFKRDRSSITLTVQAYDPLAIRLEVDSGIQSSLRTAGAIKIDEAIYVLSFEGRTGVLKNPSETEALMKSLRSGKRLAAVYRNSDRLVFDGFPIDNLDKALEELRRTCNFKG